MQKATLLALGCLVWLKATPAQTNNFSNNGSNYLANPETGVIGATNTDTIPEFVPLTRSERLRLYLMSSFGPAAFARVAAAGAIAQAGNSPKEWGGGGLAFGERIGNSFAKHVIRKSIEYGAATALREDNRYIRSTETGVWKRSKHAVRSVFVARNDAGGEHFAYSRFAGAAGASFISRAWQPRSSTSAGDGAVNFGMTIATDIGWNVVKEFRPRRANNR